MTPQQRRRSADGTRAAILDSARRLFVAQGFGRTTIRTIAADAGIDPAMVMRYFGSKDQLFQAAIVVDLNFPDLSAVPRDQVGRHLVRFFVQRWEHDDTLIALLRTAASNEESAMTKMRAIFAEQVFPVTHDIVDDPDEAHVRAILVGSQILGLAMQRYILRMSPVVDMTADQLAAWVGPTVQRYITGPSPAPE